MDDAAHPTAEAIDRENLDAAGLDPRPALIWPLARQSLQAAVERGPADALTGPVARGDLHTLDVHLAALRESGLGLDERRAHAALSLVATRLAARALPAREPALRQIRARLEEELESIERARRAPAVD